MRRLCEWKLMNPSASSNTNTAATTAPNNNSSTINYPSQEERYKKLLAQIDKEKRFNYNIVTLTDNALVFELLDPIDTKKITVAIVYKPYTNPPIWRMGVNNATTVEYEDWNEVLEVFEIPGIIKDISSLKESSIAEDFKEYDSMWMTTPQVSPNDLYIVYCDYDDGSYDILFADSDLKTVKEVFKREAVDFMFPIANADQTINLLHIKLNELSADDDKDFLSLLARFNKEEWDATEFATEENKLFGKYEELFWIDSSKFSILKSFLDVEAYDTAIDNELNPYDMTEEEWRGFVEEYVEYMVV